MRNMETAALPIAADDARGFAWGGSRRIPVIAIASAAILPILAISLVAQAGQRALAAPAEKQTQRTKPAEQPARRPLPEQDFTRPLAAQYCDAVRDAAAEDRFAHQTAQLEALAKQVDERLAKLDAHSAQLRDWVTKREAFIQKATQQLTGIFGAMRPEAASEQLVRLDPHTAAAILLKLDPRAASAIMNDMPPEKAARLAGIIVGSASKSEQANKP